MYVSTPTLCCCLYGNSEHPVGSDPEAHSIFSVAVAWCGVVQADVLYFSTSWAQAWLLERSHLRTCCDGYLRAHKIPLKVIGGEGADG